MFKENGSLQCTYNFQRDCWFLNWFLSSPPRRLLLSELKEYENEVKENEKEVKENENEVKENENEVQMVFAEWYQIAWNRVKL